MISSSLAFLQVKKNQVICEVKEFRKIQCTNQVVLLLTFEEPGTHKMNVFLPHVQDWGETSTIFLMDENYMQCFFFFFAIDVWLEHGHTLVQGSQ